MSNILRDQLLKAGVVDKHKVKNTEAEKRKQDKRLRKNKVAIDDEAARLARQAEKEKVERDRALNRQLKIDAEKKAVAAQVRQLLESHCLPRQDDGIAYHFTDDNKVKNLLVSNAQQQQLVRGQAAIVKIDERYELVPTVVAEKIRSRAPECVVLCNERQVDEKNSDDPYANYKIPDDLTW